MQAASASWADCGLNFVGGECGKCRIRLGQFRGGFGRISGFDLVRELNNDGRRYPIEIAQLVRLQRCGYKKVHKKEKSEPLESGGENAVAFVLAPTQYLSTPKQKKEWYNQEQRSDHAIFNEHPRETHGS